MEELIYLYDSSYDGILSCVFAAYENKETPQMLATEAGLQLTFSQKTRHIETNATKARRVEQGFQKKAGSQALEHVQRVFFSGKEAKGTIMFRYFVVGLTVGKKINLMLADPAVADTLALLLEVDHEVHHLTGFIRFSKLENGVFFARISPKSSAVPLLMPFFVDRFSVQPFVIYDTIHEIAGFYDMKNWQLMETNEIILPDLAAGEEDWIRLWQSFCRVISIKERENRALQRNHCPKRFWSNMPEMQEDVGRLSGQKVHLSGKQPLEIDS